MCYLDRTYITTRKYYQLLVLLFYDEYTNKKFLVNLYYVIIKMKSLI